MSDANPEENFAVGRALVLSSADGLSKFIMAVELVASRQHAEYTRVKPDDRKLHLFKLTGWPAATNTAMCFPGRGVFVDGRWEAPRAAERQHQGY